jgi:tetratricopeptide (TPR) repeat protein
MNWARSRPSPEARYWIGVAHEMAGIVRSRSADAEAAVREYDQARAVFEMLLAEYPENAAYRRELSFATMRLAGLHSGVAETSIWEPNLGDLRGAEVLMRRSLRLRESQVLRDPEDQRAVVETANRFVQLAAIVAARAPRESMRLFERAVEVFSSLPSAVRQSGYSRQLEWFAHCSAAEPLARHGRRAEALAAIRQGLAIVEPDAREAGFEKGLALLMCRYQVARARRTLGEAGVAEQLEDVATGLRRLIASQPSHVVPYIGLVQALELLAETRPRERCLLLQQVEATWKAWPQPPTSFTRLRHAEAERVLARCRSDS